jgi:hypothetical protein
MRETVRMFAPASMPGVASLYRYAGDLKPGYEYLDICIRKEGGDFNG